MSIVAIRKMTENKGCQVLMALIGVLLAVSMLMTGMWGMNGQGGQSSERIAFVLGGQKITEEQLSKRVEELAASGSTHRGNPAGELQLMASAIGSFVQRSAIRELAKEKGATVSESNIRKLAEQYGEEQIERQKIQLLISGAIKPGASEAEADKELEKLLGGPKATFIKNFADQVEAQYNDEKSRADISAEFLPLAVNQKYIETTPFTEEQLRSSYREYKFDVIRFEDTDKPRSEREDQALKALDEIRGGADFATVQKKYNPNASAEDRSVSMSPALMDADPTLAPLKNLKKGEVSDVLTQAGSPVIYRLSAITENLPKDFEQSKSALLAQRQKTAASTAFENDFKAKMESLKPEFKDAGLEIAYDTYTLLTDQTNALQPEKYRKDVEAQLDKIKSADLSVSAHSDVAAAAEFVLTETLYTLANAEEKKDMIDARLEAADRALEFYDDPALRISLAKDLLENGKPEDAVRYATAAIEIADFDEHGQQVYAQLTDLVKNSGAKLDADQKQDIQAALDNWLETKVQQDKEDAEMEAERKKAEAELDSTVIEGDGKGDKKPAQSEGEKPSGD